MRPRIPAVSGTAWQEKKARDQTSDGACQLMLSPAGEVNRIGPPGQWEAGLGEELRRARSPKPGEATVPQHVVSWPGKDGVIPHPQPEPATCPPPWGDHPCPDMEHRAHAPRSREDNLTAAPGAEPCPQPEEGPVGNRRGRTPGHLRLRNQKP